MAEWVFRVMQRDLASLAEQIATYEDEADLWRLVPGVGNSAGTLALHVAGNIQALVGAALGGTGYVRDRDAEFSRRDVPRAEILAELEAAQAALRAGLEGLDDAAMAGDYPIEVGGTHATGQMAVHLATHLTYHLGQIDYHRRILTGADAAPGMVSPRKLID